MQLINMDVDRYGTHQRCQLGPFSPGLSAVCGPNGAGKTTLLSWLRQMAADEYGRGYGVPDLRQNHSVAPVSGSVEIRNRGRHFRFSSDRNGKTQLDWFSPVESAWASNIDRGHFSGGSFDPTYALTPLQRNVFAALAAASGTADTQAELEQMARKLDLDLVDVRDQQRETLLSRQRDLETRLHRLRTGEATREALLLRHERLGAELQRAESADPGQRYRRQAECDRLDERLDAIRADLRHTLARIDAADRELAEKRAELKLLETGLAGVDVGPSYRKQLQQLDDHLNRWRQTLRDLKSHREQIDRSATDARLDKQLGDQLSATKQSDPRAALRSLEAQILDTRQRLDDLVGRHEVPHGDMADGYTGYDVQQDSYGRTRIAYTGSHSIVQPGNLPDSLKAMQKELHEVCQQLARHESHAASETLIQQSQQLQRCETELLQAVEKLIEQRGALLRKIADECHLSVEQLTRAFGEWCHYRDHLQLHEWLLQEPDSGATGRSSDNPEARERLLEEIESLEKARRQANRRLEDLRRQSRDADIQRGGVRSRAVESQERLASDIQRDLDSTAAELRDLEEGDRLRTELDEVRRQLRQLPRDGTSPFRMQVDRHIAAMMDGMVRTGASQAYRGPRHRYDLVDGIVTDIREKRVEYEVPSAIVRIAMRLTIVGAMADRHEPVSLILDESLDHLPVEIQQSAVAHVASISKKGQQVVVLTSDERVASLVRSHDGWVGYMHSATRPVVINADVNRELCGFANDHEADKWYRPNTTREIDRGGGVRGEFYLNDRSLIEDSPSIDPTAAARCRALGVDRVGDLLDVDPQWLADHVRLDGVSSSTVRRWQAEASLLCSVRQLRPFDARVLVGAGVRTPRQLAQMRPSQLFDRVERFLATQRGRTILRSGNSYELSRITTWIASAKGGANRYRRSSLVDEFDGPIEPDTLREGHPYQMDWNEDEARSVDLDRAYSRRRTRSGGARRFTRGSDRTSRPSRRSGPESGGGRTRRSRRLENGSDRNRARREKRRDARSAHERVRIADTPVRRKFYLELTSEVVDAPSIGPRMAGRLKKLGVYSVDQLLSADAETLAEKLDHRRVDAESIRAWQKQTQLVCRIPNLRGHDAQLLVACDLTSPEELATMDPESVLAQVQVVAQSNEGQRILRGGKEPDLQEVTDWINWAASCRALAAA